MCRCEKERERNLTLEMREERGKMRRREGASQPIQYAM